MQDNYCYSLEFDDKEEDMAKQTTAMLENGGTANGESDQYVPYIQPII